MPEDITKEDLLELIRVLKTPDQEVPVLTREELLVLKEIIKDRQAMSRISSWAIYLIGSISTVIVGWGIVSGSIVDWLKDHIVK